MKNGIWGLVVGALVLGSSLAQAQGQEKAAASKGREKHISREATIKSRDQKKVDFESANIIGNHKAPVGTIINQNKSDKEYDFVKIRLRWHPEMVQSASSLDSGKTR